ncbi:MAG: hypothetical protein PHQ32_00830 [Firmicutes bacterium]|nr:hypothetical protein [Bacillota bacterium]
MNQMIKKLVDQQFMTETQAEYLETAISNKDNIIISGHRGHGILPLLATLGAVAQGVGKLKPVRNIENDLNDDLASYYLIGDLKEVDYPSLLLNILSNEKVSIITIKDADHSFSVMKLLSDVYKTNKEAAKTYQLIECTKDAEGTKKIAKIVKAVQDKEGKLVRSTL